MNSNSYIKAETFQQFCTNQDKLIDILNHRMTNISSSVDKMGNSMGIMKNDVGWLKKGLWVIVGLMITTLGALLIKSFAGV